jgi:hypothetical protein
MELEQEQATFERELPRLLEEQKQWGQARQYVLIKGDKIDSAWDTHTDAVRAGFRFFGDEAFLVKKIKAEETPIACLHAVVTRCPN